MILSSDGHAVGSMESYREYLDPQYRADFDDFLPVWREFGALAISEKGLGLRLDDHVVDAWRDNFLETGRTEGYRDPGRRITEMDRSGLAGEVVFPDFGTPFALGSVSLASVSGVRPRSREHLDAGFRAHNRWAAEFFQIAPHRFAGMAAMMFDDVDRAVREIRWAHANGFRGVVLPVTPHEAQLYDLRYEPIWNTLEDLGMVLNSHVSLSAEVPAAAPPPHLTATAAIFGIDAFLAVQRVLRVLIWGGVLDRHPNLKVVFTEQHSDWVVPMLARMDFSYTAGDLRKDIHSSVRLKPSEYWQRQCYLGSSIFSRAEIRARRSIGIDKMMLGFDYPHFEGAWRLGVRDYIQATLGEQEVSEDEAQLMLGKTAAEVFRFDVDELRSVADRIGLEPESVLTPSAVPLAGVSADLDRPLEAIAY
jgi:predicted TIM-barrel fold metal-dependent hydrolase